MEFKGNQDVQLRPFGGKSFPQSGLRASSESFPQSGLQGSSSPRPVRPLEEVRPSSYESPRSFGWRSSAKRESARPQFDSPRRYNSATDLSKDSLVGSPQLGSPRNYSPISRSSRSMSSVNGYSSGSSSSNWRSPSRSVVNRAVYVPVMYYSIFVIDHGFCHDIEIYRDSDHIINAANEIENIVYERKISCQIDKKLSKFTTYMECKFSHRLSPFSKESDIKTENFVKFTSVVGSLEWIKSIIDVEIDYHIGVGECLRKENKKYLDYYLANPTAGYGPDYYIASPRTKSRSSEYGIKIEE